jgi:hypothetical protein
VFFGIQQPTQSTAQAPILFSSNVVKLNEQVCAMSLHSYFRITYVIQIFVYFPGSCIKQTPFKISIAPPSSCECIMICKRSDTPCYISSDHSRMEQEWRKQRHFLWLTTQPWEIFAVYPHNKSDDNSSHACLLLFQSKRYISQRQGIGQSLH